MLLFFSTLGHIGSQSVDTQAHTTNLAEYGPLGEGGGQIVGVVDDSEQTLVTLSQRCTPLLLSAKQPAQQSKSRHKFKAIKKEKHKIVRLRE